VEVMKRQNPNCASKWTPIAPMARAAAKWLDAKLTKHSRRK